MRFNYPIAYRKSEACSTHFSGQRAVDLVKFIEHFIQIFWWNPYPCVAYPNFYLPVQLFGSYGDFPFSTRREFNSVIKEVYDYLSKLFSVALNWSEVFR